jgi:hypothetical protein
MTPNRISISAPPRDSVSVDLVGTEYLVKPPKSTIAIAFAERVKTAGDDPGALMREVEGYIVIAFGKAQATKVMKRLQDDGDDLDIPQIIELIQKLAEVATPNPSS